MDLNIRGRRVLITGATGGLGAETARFLKAEGVALLIAGAVLLTPGFVTDALGFSLLVPSIRRALIGWAVKSGIKVETTTYYATPNTPRQNEHGDIIEGEYTERK